MHLGFTYYHDIGEYLKEYRKIKKTISSDLKTCACHGGYTQKDVDKMYEALPKIKKRSANTIQLIAPTLSHISRVSKYLDSLSKLQLVTYI